MTPLNSDRRDGATLKKLDDKSLLASGTNPEVETYTVVARTDRKNITAFRLEVLPDASFTANGPGRSVNGNIVLTNVTLAAGPASESAAAAKPVRVKTASADFSQKDFPVANAIDADPKTGWAIHPEVGKPHAAIFEIENPIAGKAESLLSVTIDFQSQFAQHQCGKFRLSITSAKNPHAGLGLPEKIAKILAVAPEKRDDPQRGELRTYFRTQVAPEGRRLSEQLAGLRQGQAELDKLIPTAMIMQEMPTPRDTFMLIRGQYDKKGEKVTGWRSRTDCPPFRKTRSTAWGWPSG